MPQRSLAPSEQALIDLWDLVDRVRLKQSEAHAAIVARRAYEAARTPPKEITVNPEKEKELRRLLEDIYDTYMQTIATKDADAQRRGIRYKATGDIASALDAVSAAADAGDAAAFDRALQALAQFRPQQQAAGRRARASDTSPMAPIGATKELSTSALLDGISRDLQKTGGHSL